MARLPLLGGSYSARSIIANCQRCINLYPEQNSEDAPVPITHYQRGGLRPLVQGPVAPVRGLYRASNGNGYAVIGTGVYAIGTNWTLTKLGELVQDTGVPVSFIDNGTTIVLVDSSAFGYTIQLGDNSFAQISDGTGIFTGATRVDTMDGFVLWNIPRTRQWGSTLNNEIVFDPTYIASKSTYPDPLQTLIVNRHELLLIGQLKSEIFYNAGNSLFPFAQLPGAYVEHGTVAPYSVASQDINVYWLGQDLQGQGMVFRQRGYNTNRISNHALEFALQQMAASGSTLTDAIGFTYQQGGHVFYQLEFPSGNQTWVFDEALGANPNIAWHQQCWTDANGRLNRDRLNCMAFINGVNVGGDHSNGTLYAVDQNYYVDTVDSVDYPISFIRTFPHIGVGTTPQGMPAMADGKRMEFISFMADLECGTTALDANGNAPQVVLRWSDDRGRTWGNDVLQPAGAVGEYLTRPTWRATGIARDRVFELEYSYAGPAALNGAWVEAKLLGT